MKIDDDYEDSERYDRLCSVSSSFATLTPLARPWKDSSGNVATLYERTSFNLPPFIPKSTVAPEQRTVKMAFENDNAYPESDADDEYERSVHDSSPILATDDEASPTSSDDGGRSSNEHTPTTYGKMSAGGGGMELPETIITEWTVDECADFVGSLGLRQYADSFVGRYFLCSPCFHGLQ